MKKAILGITFILMVAVSFSLSSLSVVVRAQPVGIVCLTPVSATSCPSPPVTVSALVGSQLTVAVLVQGSDAFSGFDITLKANHTALKPADASVAGSLLGGGSILVKCIGGVLKLGPACSSTDNSDTLHMSMVGPPGFLTVSPVTGLLFTAVYNVTSSATTPISYQIGCSPSSVSGTTTCVTFSNGSLSILQETIQGATFTQAPIPTFAIGASSAQSMITVAKGESGNSTITVSSINGFSGTVTISLGVSPNPKHPPSVSLSATSVTLIAGGSGTVLLVASAVSNTTKGSYTITVTGTSGSESGSVQIQLSVVAV